MKSVPPALLGNTRNTGWFRILRASARNWMRRLPLSPNLQFFCTEKSRICAQGPRAPSIDLGAEPIRPTRGRANAAGLRYGWQLAPIGQLRFHSGLMTGT